MSKNSGGKGSVALLKESIQLGCVSRDSYQRKSTLVKEGQLEAVKFSGGTWLHIKKSGKKGSIARRHSKV